MNPVIVYVDDEPRNLTVFEASLPENWKVHCFDSAIAALKGIKELHPWVIISDQKMPEMTGLEFLEIVSQIVPEAIRVVVTGQTEEQTIIQLIRRAKIFDYITKPWDSEGLLNQLTKAAEYYDVFQQRKKIVEELKAKNDELAKANEREVELRNEIGAWVPAPILWAIKEKTLQLPAHRNLVGITYDIINSSALHGVMVQNKSIKSQVQRMFIECLLKVGGLKESISGDSVYGHFGAVDFPHNPYTAAMMVAQEFRVALRSFSKLNNVKVECGVAVHYAPSTLIDFHEVRMQTAQGPITQKWFDTSSSHVDLLHRMEKLVHELPGSNVIVTAEFLKHLPEKHVNLTRLGETIFKGQTSPVELYALLSDQVTPDVLSDFKKKHFSEKKAKAAA